MPPDSAIADVVSPYLATSASLVILLGGSSVLAILAAISFVRWRRDERVYRMRVQATADGLADPRLAVTRRDDREYWMVWTAVLATAFLGSQAVFSVAAYPLLFTGECVAATLSDVHVYPDYRVATSRRFSARVVGAEMRADLVARPVSGCAGEPLSREIAATGLSDADVSAEQNRLASGQRVPFVVSAWRPRAHVFGATAGIRPARGVAFLGTVAVLSALWVGDPRRLRRWLNQQARRS